MDLEGSATVCPIAPDPHLLYTFQLGGVVSGLLIAALLNGKNILIYHTTRG